MARHLPGMTSVPASLLRALGQLSDPAVLRVLVKSVAVTLLLFVAAAAAGWYALDRLLEAYRVPYASEAGPLIAFVLSVLGAWLLFRFVALAVLQFFADEIVKAVERRHYPAEAARARELPFREELANSLRGLARAVLVNLIALPFALALLVTGLGTAILFWAVNAWLLGRELQDMVWLRHAHAAGAKPPLSGGQRFFLGGAIAALLLIPFANLLAPVIGAASATHLIHRRHSSLQEPE